jgi:hypothetical protein
MIRGRGSAAAFARSFARAACASGLFGSKRGGSVCLLT